MKKVFKIILIVLVVIAIIIFVLLKVLPSLAVVSNDYQNKVQTGGDIEAKYMKNGQH